MVTNGKINVLHAVPNSSQNPDMFYHGSTKDVLGRTEYFLDRGIDYCEWGYRKNGLAPELSFIDISKYSHILVEYPQTLSCFDYIRSRNKKAQILVRSHNSEILHRMDYLRAIRNQKGGFRTYKNDAWNLWNMARKDFATARRADHILSIVEWETRNYWQFFPRRGVAQTMPYFLPTRHADEIEVPGHKEQLCVCVGSVAGGGVTFDAVINFVRAVELLGRKCSDWRFVVTGEVPDQIKANSAERVEFIGLQASPFEVIKPARAVALLSGLGRGFKTKIIEAIMSGNFVLVTPSLFARLPDAVRPYCLTVEPERPATFAAALERCLGPIPKGDPNAELKAQAFEALDVVFRLNDARKLSRKGRLAPAPTPAQVRA